MLLPGSADPTHHVHDQMAAEKTPVSRLLETRVLQGKEKRQLKAGRARESGPLLLFPRITDNEEVLRCVTLFRNLSLLPEYNTAV